MRSRVLAEVTERIEADGARAETMERKSTLLKGCSFLIGRRKLAELGDGSGDHAQGEVNVCRSGVAAEAEAQAGAGFFRRQANGGKHVRWLDGAGGTGGAGRTSKAFQIERDEEGFAFYHGK